MINKLIPYFGGKQNLLEEIIRLIPSHNVYIEPFCGGASVFFSKQLAKFNIINDLDDGIYAIYYCIKKDPERFYAFLNNIPYGMRAYRKAQKFIKEGNCNLFILAISKFIMLTHSIYHRGTSFNCSLTGGEVRNYNNYIDINRQRVLIDKIKQCCLCKMDALRIIKTYDSPNSFFYIDPPYINTICGDGVYSKYTEEEYLKLIDLLKNIKGKFILSNYKSNIDLYCDNNGWNRMDIEKKLFCNSMNKRIGVKTENLKTESLVWNYDICNKLW